MLKIITNELLPSQSIKLTLIIISYCAVKFRNFMFDLYFCIFLILYALTQDIIKTAN